jgi:hypothetical protein
MKSIAQATDLERGPVAGGSIRSLIVEVETMLLRSDPFRELDRFTYQFSAPTARRRGRR